MERIQSMRKMYQTEKQNSLTLVQREQKSKILERIQSEKKIKLTNQTDSLLSISNSILQIHFYNITEFDLSFLDVQVLEGNFLVSVHQTLNHYERGIISLSSRNGELPVNWHFKLKFTFHVSTDKDEEKIVFVCLECLSPEDKGQIPTIKTTFENERDQLDNLISKDSENGHQIFSLRLKGEVTESNTDFFVTLSEEYHENKVEDIEKSPLNTPISKNPFPESRNVEEQGENPISLLLTCKHKWFGNLRYFLIGYVTFSIISTVYFALILFGYEFYQFDSISQLTANTSYFEYLILFALCSLYVLLLVVLHGFHDSNILVIRKYQKHNRVLDETIFEKQDPIWRNCGNKGKCGWRLMFSIALMGSLCLTITGHLALSIFATVQKASDANLAHFANITITQFFKTNITTNDLKYPVDSKYVIIHLIFALIGMGSLIFYYGFLFLHCPSKCRAFCDKKVRKNPIKVCKNSINPGLCNWFKTVTSSEKTRKNPPNLLWIWISLLYTLGIIIWILKIICFWLFVAFTIVRTVKFTGSSTFIFRYVGFWFNFGFLNDAYRGEILYLNVVCFITELATLVFGVTCMGFFFVITYSIHCCYIGKKMTEQQFIPQKNEDQYIILSQGHKVPKTPYTSTITTPGMTTLTAPLKSPTTVFPDEKVLHLPEVK